MPPRVVECRVSENSPKTPSGSPFAFAPPPDDEAEPSEFGAGIVVCLAKFSEHLWNDHYERIRHMAWWAALDETKRQQQREEAARFPVGDAARRLAAVHFLTYQDTPEKALSRQIEMWMNGASDHFYDLDKERAPEPLRELGSLALRIGHGFTGETWTMEHVERIRDLWKQSCLALDERLGTKPDWGQW